MGQGKDWFGRWMPDVAEVHNVPVVTGSRELVPWRTADPPRVSVRVSVPFGSDRHAGRADAADQHQSDRGDRVNGRAEI